ncbi:MAG: aspartyl/glutamyl-tRNA amidotransferase subunit C [Treponema sp.]|nr:aspartyl/glutamyl-tRNA amidotransferase subunit C [Treponema sp.]
MGTISIDDELIKYLEDLSCLSLSPDERRQISFDLEKILASMELLSQYTCSGDEEAWGGHGREDLRLDEVKTAYRREDVLFNAPVSDGAFFIIPKVRE